MFCRHCRGNLAGPSSLPRLLLCGNDKLLGWELTATELLDKTLKLWIADSCDWMNCISSEVPDSHCKESPRSVGAENKMGENMATMILMRFGRDWNQSGFDAFSCLLVVCFKHNMFLTITRRCTGRGRNVYSVVIFLEFHEN